MDIRLFCYRCFVFLGLWVGYEAQNGNQTTHQRTDDVEEAEGQIHQCRDAEHGALRHAAGSPRYEYGGDRGGIFRTAAQQLWSIATCRIFLLVDGGVHDDAEELVAHHQVEQYARCHGGANERHGAVDAYAGIAHGLLDHLLEDAPFHLVNAHAKGHAYGGGYHEGYL